MVENMYSKPDTYFQHTFLEQLRQALRVRLSEILMQFDYRDDVHCMLIAVLFLVDRRRKSHGKRSPRREDFPA